MKNLGLVLIALAVLLLASGCSKKSTEPGNTVKTPKFVLPAGTYEAGQYISISCATEEAEIHYTTDLSDPSPSSPLYVNSLQMPDFFINNASYCTVKAKAFRSDLLPSVTASATYKVEFDQTVDTPVITPPGGTFNHCPITISVTCAEPGAQIRYTTDGSTPTYMSDLYTGQFDLNGCRTVKAQAFKAGMNSSETGISEIIEKIYKLGSVGTSGIVYDVAVEGNFAYVADGDNGLRIYQIGDPANPVAAGSLTDIDIVSVVKLWNGYAYVMGGYGGVTVVDISNPFNPVAVDFFGVAPSTRDITFSGNYAYAGGDYGFMSVYDISNPSNCVPVAEFNAGETVQSLQVQSNYLYVGCMSTLKIYDISNHSAPVLMGQTNPGSIRGLAVQGNYAYVAAWSYGLRIINISNPAAPAEVGHLDTPDWAYGVKMAYNYAYVADSGSGVRIIDISNPAAPVEAGYCVTGNTVDNLFLYGDKLYVAEEAAGMSIYHNGFIIMNE
jgi:hypothetical protein